MKPAVHDRPSASADSPPSAREDERRRLARDLHDGPAQTLAAALFGVDLAVNALDRAPATARDELLAARALVRDALDDVRALMAGLRPRLLEERGLVVALNGLAAMPPLWGTEVSVETAGYRPGRAIAGGRRARALPHRAGGGQQRPAAWRGEPRPGVAGGQARRRGAAGCRRWTRFLVGTGVWLVQEGRGIARHARAGGASGRHVAGRVGARGRDADRGDVALAVGLAVAAGKRERLNVSSKEREA